MKLDYMLNWAEYFAITLMITGFLVAIIIESAWLNYIVVVIAGLMAGRLIYGRRDKTKFTHYLIIIGFLLGYMLGSYTYSKKIIATLFILSAIISYYIHKKGYIDKYMPVKDPHKSHW